MGAIIPISRFKLVDPHGKLGKISNNLETHGEELVTGFTYPFEVMLTEEALDALMGKYFWRSIFNIDAQTKLPTPINGFMRCKPLELEDTYEGVRATIEKNNMVEVFEKCRVSKLVFQFKVGGLTLCSGHLYLRPGTDEINVWLQHLQQKTDVSIEMLDGAVEKKASNKQQQALPLPNPDEKASSSKEPPPPPPEPTGPGAALNQALGEIGVETPQLAPNQYADGTFKTGAEIDAALHARHPELKDEVMGADAKPAEDDPENDLEAFQKGAEKKAADFKKLATTGGKAIDGRSERVKHQDRQRGKQH